MQSNEGINYLARVFDGRTDERTYAPPTIDFGEIKGDMSLQTNYFPQPIPQSDYMVCRCVAWGKKDDVWYQTQAIGKENSGEHKHGPNGQHNQAPSADPGMHSHPEDQKEMQHVQDYLIGDKTRWLEAGDRVLVVWVGDDPCVVDIIYPATEIKE